MNSVKTIIFAVLILFFLAFSFYPTLFDLSLANNLGDPNREYILEHNYYWPDYNLYLSKIRQGLEGRLTALEKYTSEPHQGSFIQEFYVFLGLLGRIFNLDPNLSYLLGRIILSPLLLLVIFLFVRFYFPAPTRFNLVLGRKIDPFIWQILAFLIIITSGSFPKFYTDSNGTLHVYRYMEWWSNIDALQRITFIPHILFGQVVSFYLLYLLTIRPPNHLTGKGFILLVILGNLAGLVFPPSLMTLNGVLILTILIKTITSCVIFKQHKIFKARIFAQIDKIMGGKKNTKLQQNNNKTNHPNNNNNYEIRKINKQNCDYLLRLTVVNCEARKFYLRKILLFVIFSSISLLYIFFLTKQIPWSALVEFHRTHPMMIPFWQYILGTGPVFFLGIAGAVVSIIKRQRKFQPLIFWVLITFAFAVFFTHMREQSPLRFTQTGLFIPLGILGAYFFHELFLLSDLSRLSNLLKPTITIILSLYLLTNLYMMTVSLRWQTTWLSQRARANIPLVPYPPQAMFPLKNWMDGIRWLRDNTNHDEVVLAEITAGNHIPAYSGNTVYFGQSNTYDYERKQLEVAKFFKGEMTPMEAKSFIEAGRIKYIFYSVQEKERLGKKNLKDVYPFIKPVFDNQTVIIYTY